MDDLDASGVAVSGPAPAPARVAVLGAGVIGRVIAARLALAGIDATLLARGHTLQQLSRDGVRLSSRGRVQQVPVPTADTAAPGSFDLVFLSVRAPDLDGVLPVVDRIDGSPVVVPLMHLGDRYADLVVRFGADRVVRAFPGFGGYVDEAGTVEWLDLGSKQPTTVDWAAPRSDVVWSLGATGLALDRTDDMDGWMQVHVVFVATMGAGVVLAEGDLTRLAADRALIRATVDATRDGFRALVDRGVRITPRSIETLYMWMPRWFAIEYWRSALPGPVGRITMAPHALASRYDEMPLLWREALRLTGGGRTGVLRRLLEPLTGGDDR